MSYLLDASGHLTDAGWTCAKVWETEGRAIKWISRQVGVTPKSVRYNLVRPAPSARPQRTPPRMSVAAQRIATCRKTAVGKYVLAMENGNHGPRRKFPSALCIAKAWNQAHPGNEISASTVRRDLKDAGMRSLKRQRGPKRVAGDPERRLSVARGYLKKGSKFLKRVGFTDAKYFNSNSHGAQREWCQPGQQPSRQVQDTWAPHVHVWGFIAKNMRFLCRIPNHKPTAASYKQKCLIPLLKYLNSTPEGKNVVLQYDGDTAYGTPAILAYLERKGITTLRGWAARSPDWSAIENMWAIVQRRVDRYGPKDADELWAFVVRAWNDVPVDQVNNLVESFERRLRKCVLVNGATISTKTKKGERNL